MIDVPKAAQVAPRYLDSTRASLVLEEMFALDARENPGCYSHALGYLKRYGFSFLDQVEVLKYGGSTTQLRATHWLVKRIAAARRALLLRALWLALLGTAMLVGVFGSASGGFLILAIGMPILVIVEGLWPIAIGLVVAEWLMWLTWTLV